MDVHRPVVATPSDSSASASSLSVASLGLLWLLRSRHGQCDCGVGHLNNCLGWYADLLAERGYNVVKEMGASKKISPVNSVKNSKQNARYRS